MAQAVTAAALRVSKGADGPSPALVVSGRADYSNISRIVAALDNLREEHERCVSVDLEGVESIDTAAMEGLAGSAGSFRSQQKRLRLKAASVPVRKALDRLLLTELFCEQDCDSTCSPHTCRGATKAWEIDVFSLPYDLVYCQEARTRVDRVAEAVGFSESRRTDVMLAVGEAVTNAVRHGAPETGEGCFTVSCLATPDKLCVSVSDGGSGFLPESIPSLEETILLETGRGIYFMNALMDEVDFHIESGTTVRMVKLGM